MKTDEKQISPWDELLQPMKTGWTFALSEEGKYAKAFRLFSKLFEKQEEINRLKRELARKDRERNRFVKNVWAYAKSVGIGLGTPEKRFRAKKIDSKHINIIYLGEKG